MLSLKVCCDIFTFGHLKIIGWIRIRSFGYEFFKIGAYCLKAAI